MQAGYGIFRSGMPAMTAQGMCLYIFLHTGKLVRGTKLPCVRLSIYMQIEWRPESGCLEVRRKIY